MVIGVKPSGNLQQSGRGRDSSPGALQLLNHLASNHPVAIDGNESGQRFLGMLIEKNSLLKLGQGGPWIWLLYLNLTQHHVRRSRLRRHGHGASGNRTGGIIFALGRQDARIEQQRAQVGRLLAHHRRRFLLRRFELLLPVLRAGQRQQCRCITGISRQGAVPFRQGSSFVSFALVQLSQNEVRGR